MKGRFPKPVAAAPSEVPIIRPRRVLDIEPELGYCVVRYLDAGTSAGGLHLPGVEPRVLLVATSGRYPVTHGMMAEHAAKPGDEVMLAPALTNAQGQIVSAPLRCTIVSMRPKHYVMKLSDIIAVVRESGEQPEGVPGPEALQ